MTMPTAAKWASIIVASAAALYFWTSSTPPVGESQYFFDVSEGRLYTAPRTDFAPVAGVGGEAGDGVEALVVRCPRCDAGDRRIALLTTHTPDFKAKDAGKRANPGQGIPGLTREYIRENTLVRTPDETQWHKTSTPEGSKRVAGWKRKCEKHGEWERPVLP